MESAISHPSFRGVIGVSRRIITPPVGIYARNWGSAQHEAAEGVHRPLTATVISIAANEGDAPFVLVSLDLGWWRSVEDELFFRAPVLSELGLDDSRLMIHLTHTHAGPSLSLQVDQKPGGGKVRPYVLSVQAAVIDAIQQATRESRNGTISWNSGRCNLACHRDQVLPDGGSVVGYAPFQKVDGTVLVGRVTDDLGATYATIINYACHPTTLGGSNRLISPDYVGATREIVEQATNGAPCLFLQGASGELAPRRQYSGSPELADQNGRQLGFAALATLADMLPHRCDLQFTHVEESTTRLGSWDVVQCWPDNKVSGQLQAIELPLRQMPRPSDVSTTRYESIESENRATIERIERLIDRWNGFEDSGTAAISIWVWRLGGAIFVGVPAEMHSAFQLELRRHFNNCAVVVVNLVNGCYGYLPPLADFSQPTYQCDASLFQAGAHETVLELCIASIEDLIVDGTSDAAIALTRISTRVAPKTVQGESR